MNKTLLLIVCDFLLISLLALARFDMEDPAESLRDQETVTQADPENDVLEMLKQSLEEEQRVREEMNRQLELAQNQLQSNASQLTEQQRARQEAERRLREKEEEARRLAAERAALQGTLQTNRTELSQVRQEYQATRTNLLALQREYVTAKSTLETTREQFEATQRKLEETRRDFDQTQAKVTDLNQALQEAQSQSRVNQQLVQQLQQDLTAQVQKASAMQQQMVQLDQQREAAVVQSEQLAGRLQVAQTETKLTREQLQETKQQVATVQQEKEAIQQQTTQLAENVGTLADTSVEIKEEIRQSRPMTPNTIFSDFTSNRVSSTFQGVRPGIFGQDSTKEAATRSIVFTQNGQNYAVYHVTDTPLEFFAPAVEWRSLFLTLRHGQAIASAKQLRFVDREPRVIIVPLTPDQVRELGVKAYPIAKDLFKFEEAVLVGTRDSYYGECSFQIDPETPGYMRMQKERFGRIFGKFVPSKGDLVFSKQGELIGVMANDDYCMVLENLQSSRAVTLGNNLAGGALAGQLQQMYFQIQSKPGRLR